MNYDPRSEPHNLAHDPVTSLVVPRPIGWITTISQAGVVNLAPYSFFNLVAGRRQPFVMFSSHGRKHSQRNAETAGEFVFNLVTFDLRSQMNQTGAEVDETISEPETAGLTMAPSRVVKPPRVALSPVALECKYCQTVVLSGSDGKATDNSVVIGEVVNIYIDDRVIVDGMLDVRRMRPVARLGYMDYCVVDERVHHAAGVSCSCSEDVPRCNGPGLRVFSHWKAMFAQLQTCQAPPVTCTFRLSSLTHPYSLVDL